MKILGIWIIITVLMVFSLVTTGMLERILWIITTVFIIIQYLKAKRNTVYDKEKYKKIFIGIIIGYFLSIALLLYIQYQVEEIHVGKNYVTHDQTAIILVLKGEPSYYDLPIMIKNHRNNNDLWKSIWLPFELFKGKLNYERADAASSFYYGTRLQYQLSKVFKEEYNIYLAYSHSKPYLNEIINTAMVEGNQNIILTPVLLTESNDFNLIENKLKEINPSQYGVNTRTTYPLWDSEGVAISFVEQINYFTSSTRKQNVGIILVGKKVKRGEENLTYVKQDLLFRDKVKDYLVLDGYNKNKIRLTFFDNKDITKEIEALMEYGVGEIIVVPTPSSLQSIKHQLTLKKNLQKIEAPYAVYIHKIDAWRFNDYIIEELVNRIRLLKL